ncbi:octanoyl-[GcvH]:protein N-octanoyltransferase [Pisciglobus halotolerans]|uniref:Octanoyl-[GcvH]:protein N-octanoyltransferase n=2 Tax=Pisciglobus halotolerans TaxID=745365 RepID=A0A1I3AXA5_9LACT|nr:octanoyl-[GcvH]:protein N-octanoyltransferase [Pisciglobus halotolerans]
MKKVYILSHSHWDREWYLPYEQHHMRLVELIDDVLALFETDPEFKSFHLDGQTIILEDYLQVRPEKEALLRKHIENGKLKIGPFYILQDAFLTSSESNVRNMLIGIEDSRKWGAPVEVGYFPDTFGNMGQTPQLMRQVGFKTAAFGRGVKTTGFNNAVVDDEKYASQFSEMWWKGPDGSEILGLLFANWYSNGNEVPDTPEEAKAFWDQKLADAEQYASTDHLLMMNGCDHQPVQKNLSKAIRLANELYPDVTFIHASFDEYLAALEKDLPKNLNTVTGELTSQETDGWYTLANTASSRMYLKQWNARVSRQLENIAEPLATMAYEETGEYPHDQLTYAWKTLMQNHPHDSICGCSVDEVHRENVTRFEKANEVGKYLADEAAAQLIKNIDTASLSEEGSNGYPFVVFNTSGSEKTGSVTTWVEVERLPFSEGMPQELYARLKERKGLDFEVKNAQGEVVPSHIIADKVDFHYDLPKDKFRQPFVARYVQVELLMTDVPGLSWQTFLLAPAAEKKAASTEANIASSNGRVLENRWLKAEIKDNGTLTVENKDTGKVYENLLQFEDVGDIGNEYIFKQPENERPIYSMDSDIEVQTVKNTELAAAIEITANMEIPVSADERLEEEQRSMIEFRYREAQRSKETTTMVVKTTVTLEKDSRQLKFATKIVNNSKDHRLRVLFPTSLQTDTHFADSIFEVVERPNKVNKDWQNPTNPQHTHAFVNLHDAENGMTVATVGLNEYEVLAQNDQQTIAVTLLRSVGELGDWGYFPTPEAQCLDTYTMTYALSFHGQKGIERTYQEAMNVQVPFSVYQTSVHSGSLKPDTQFIAQTDERLALTAFKRNKENNQIVTRLYNLANEEVSLDLKVMGHEAQNCNLLEEPEKTANPSVVEPFEIVTQSWQKN